VISARPIIYRANLHEICRIGRLELCPQMNDVMLIFDTLTWTLQRQPIFVSFIGLARHSVKVQVMRWTQADQLTNQLVITNKQLWGQPGRLQSGFALRLLFMG